MPDADHLRIDVPDGESATVIVLDFEPGSYRDVPLVRFGGFAGGTLKELGAAQADFQARRNGFETLDNAPDSLFLSGEA